MHNSLFLIFLVLSNLTLLSICLMVYLFKTVIGGVKKILDRELALEELKEKLAEKEKAEKEV